MEPGAADLVRTEAAVVAAVAGGPVEVIGEGPLADRLRARLVVSPSAADERPGTIIETTGSPEEVEAALARVGDLGAVVLVGPPPNDPPTLDLYRDLHVRGLTVVGLSQT